MSASILAAIDLSHERESTAILKRAAQLAALDGAKLNVITVVPDYGTSFVATFFEEGTLKKALAKAQEMLHDFVDSTLPGHDPIQHIIGVGSVYEEVLNAARRVEADLIIMGAVKPGVAANLLGPNAARVARHFEGSVLIHRMG